MNNIDEAKKMLKDYKQLLIRKKQLATVIEELDRIVTSAKSPNFEQNMSGGYDLSISEKIARLVDLEHEFERINIQLQEKILIIERILMKVAEEQTLGANILHYKFVDNLTLEAISVIINYSYRNTVRIYNSAIRSFYINFQKEVTQNG